MAYQEKLLALKRKLSADRKDAYKSKLKIDQDRREAKRLREKNRYQEKKKMKNDEKQRSILEKSQHQTLHSPGSVDVEKLDPGIEPSHNDQTELTNPEKRSGKNEKAKKKITKTKSLEQKRKMASERQRKRLAKIYADPDLYSMFLKRQKNNNGIRKKKGLRSISDMSTEQQLIQRRRWKRSQAQYRKRQNCGKESNVTPNFESLSPKSLFTKAGAMKARENIKSMKNKIANLEQEKQKLMKETSDLRRQSDLYRKICERLLKDSEKVESPSPKEKASQVMIMER